MCRSRFSLADAWLPCLALALLLAACGDDTAPTSLEPEPTNQVPEVAILSPEGNAVFEHNDEIVFHAEAKDPEDGTLAGTSLVWTSDLDSEIGTGTEFSRSDLSVGRHQIIVEAEDSEGDVGKDGTFISVAEEPEVDLGVQLPRPDLSAEPEITIADGEAFVLRWEVSGEPESSCRASGDWRGNKPSSGADTTGANPGPANLTYVLECENDLGVDVDTAHVTVGALGEVHARSNRPDTDDEQMVRFLYVIPEGGNDRNFDLNGTIENQFEGFQDRFEDKTNRRFRVDTYNNKYDITFAVIDTSKSSVFINELIRNELQERGLYDREQYFHVIFFDAYPDAPSNGGGRTAYIYNLTSGAKDGNTVGHELVHAHGIVDKNAPNYEASHVSDHEHDLMDNASAGKPFSTFFILDYGCDDYYWDPDLDRCADVPRPEGNITLLSDSPVLVIP